MVVFGRGHDFVETSGMAEELQELIGVAVNPLELAPFVKYDNPGDHRHGQQNGENDKAESGGILNDLPDRALQNNRTKYVSHIELYKLSR